MIFQKFLKALIAGMFFPSLFLPVAYSILFAVDARVELSVVAQFVPMFLPIVFGLTNALMVWIGNYCPLKSHSIRLWVTGACLGLLVAAVGIFVLHLPTALFGFTDVFQYAPLIFLPIIYGLIFRYIIHPVNQWFSL